MSKPKNLWISRRGVSTDSETRLFCLPHAGGGAAVYHRWSREMDPRIDVVPVLLPGRESRIQEPPRTELCALVAEIADGLEEHTHARYALFGHSMGALLAFELAREFRRRGAPPPLRLFVAAYRAPQLPRQTEPIHTLPDKQFLAELHDRFAGMPPEVAQSPELLKLFLPILRADVTLIETYEYEEEPPLECPITALGGTEDLQVAFADLAAWRVQTTGPFVQRMLPGGHFFVASRQEDVIRIVRGALDRHLSQGPRDDRFS